MFRDLQEHTKPGSLPPELKARFDSESFLDKQNTDKKWSKKFAVTPQSAVKILSVSFIFKD